MKAFEKLEKREVKRREALQKTKKEAQSNDESIDDHVDINATTNSEPAVEQKSKPVQRTPAPRRRRNKSGPAVRRRTASANASQPVSEEENSNSVVSHDYGSGDGVPAPSTRIPAPAEVGSTCVGTIGSLSTTGFRFPKTKKVCPNFLSSTCELQHTHLSLHDKYVTTSKSYINQKHVLIVWLCKNSKLSTCVFNSCWNQR